MNFGGRDHTTVIHAHEKISQLLKTDQVLKNDLAEIEKNLEKHKICFNRPVYNVDN